MKCEEVNNRSMGDADYPQRLSRVLTCYRWPLEDGRYSGLHEVLAFHELI
jgi:hypothetical protein